ncbi:MAG TPA: chromate efflux transporter [Saprospiraceae bacterium]|mgnify:FL=1|nr:chromate efflux transporter [Saprospiraceae bacterium]
MANLKEVFLLFFRLGLTAFGGPAAHISMMEQEVVSKRKWMSREHFMDLVGMTNLIPGPNSTEMTMHCGYERAGVAGLFVAGIAFIVPAVTLTSLFAYFYVEYGEIPDVKAYLVGIKPAVVVIIGLALWKLGKTSLKTTWLWVVAIIAVLLCALGMSEIAVLFLVSIVSAIIFYSVEKKEQSFFIAPLFVVSGVSNVKIFFSFLKIGAILYGSGYALIAYLQSEFVETGLLSSQEVIDAVGVGQFTPGPVLSTAAFVGYLFGGFGTSIIASLGIFLPSFIFVLVLNPIIPKLRKSQFFSIFLNSVNAVVVALIFWVLVEFIREVLIDWRAIVIALVCTLIMFLFKLKFPSYWLVIVGSVLGKLLSIW